MSRTKKKILIDVHKIIFVLLLIGFLSTVYRSGNAKDVPLGSIESKLVNSKTIASMEKSSDRDLAQFWNLQASNYKEVLYFKNTGALAVDELLIIKVNDRSQIKDIKDAIDARVKAQTKVFDGYGPKQIARLNNAKSITKGNYVFFCVAKKPDKIAEVFTNAI